MKGKAGPLLVLAAILAAIWAFFYFVVPPWFWHPIGNCTAMPPRLATLCRGYNAWSGILGSFITSLPGWAIAITLWCRHHNCKHKGCWKLGHPHPEHGRPMCDEHVHMTPHGFRRHHGAPALWKEARHHMGFQRGASASEALASP